MKNIFNKIFKILKKLMESNIEINSDNHSKYNINKNKDCNISINENGVNNEKK